MDREKVLLLLCVVVLFEQALLHFLAVYGSGQGRAGAYIGTGLEILDNSTLKDLVAAEGPATDTEGTVLGTGCAEGHHRLDLARLLVDAAVIRELEFLDHRLVLILGDRHRDGEVDVLLRADIDVILVVLLDVDDVERQLAQAVADVLSFVISLPIGIMVLREMKQMQKSVTLED